MYLGEKQESAGQSREARATPEKTAYPEAFHGNDAMQWERGEPAECVRTCIPCSSFSHTSKALGASKGFYVGEWHDPAHDLEI